MPEPKQLELFEFKRIGRASLGNAGTKPIVISCLDPRPHAVELFKEPPPRITEEDAKWLRECGVAWEAQMPLDFSGCRKDEQGPKALASQKKEEPA